LSERERVGYAYVFENVVVYDNPMQLGKRLKTQLGEFLGIVKGLIPNDPYYVLYQRLKHRSSWLRRHPQRTLDSFCIAREKS
jgi:hypothetical protein